MICKRPMARHFEPQDSRISFSCAQPAPDLDLVQIDEMTTRTIQNNSTRSYGGFATDLNEDGWMDITVVNENTADLRTFLNRADASGLFGDFLVPPAEVNDRASPSEPSDFNRDGHGDVCVVNIDTDSVSILLGNGDGTFAPQQEIIVGDAPRGIAVLDVDGDGDTDIVNTNSASGNLSLLLNNGDGVFGSPTFFDGGGSGEWSLAAADMDNDNVLDLVVGAQGSQQILINKCNGDGTFSHVSTQSSGGRTWMLVCGDLNGDGNQDLTSANSSNNNGSILLGNGDGTLRSPVTYPTDSFPLATDVADLDGDGDLDWVTASFSGDWFVFTNDGDGTFTFDQEINAPLAASCSLAVDIDNDLDLDLALIDELEDVVILMRNGGYSVIANSFTPFRGLHKSGTLADTFTSNDSYLKFNPGITLLSSEAPVWLIFDGTLRNDSPGSLDFALESSANTVGLQQTVEMFDWNTKQFVEIETVESSFNLDSVQTVDLTPGVADYVQSGTGAVRARIGYRRSGIVLLYPWTICIDRVVWIER